ncbi:hypothetical protein JCM19046_4887 [Bacillus sp. JCM 19046]|nr:hypothetical protein JCM19045_7 [Bacillus sp. JCM 19045]GAF20181.1 hypothetical protein JCM19046_4887 [Bacillus sp. JCM 19046]
MNLSIEKASKLLNKVGIATSVDQDSIKEVVPYYDNFYQLKKINQAWEYSLVIKEQTNQPSQLEVKVFQDEAEGIRYFFLNRLSRWYDKSKIAPLNKHFSNQKSIKEVKEVMGRGNIPEKMLSTTNSLSGTGVLFKQVNESQYSISIYKDGVEIRTTIPLSSNRALTLAFRKAVLIYIFETQVEPMLKKEGITLHQPEDLILFLG